MLNIELLKTKIQDTPLSPRARNALLRDEKYKFKYLGDLITLPNAWSYLRHIDGYGNRSHQTLEQYLKKLKLCFEMIIPEWKQIRKSLEND